MGGKFKEYVQDLGLAEPCCLCGPSTCISQQLLQEINGADKQGNNMVWLWKATLSNTTVTTEALKNRSSETRKKATREMQVRQSMRRLRQGQRLYRWPEFTQTKDWHESLHNGAQNYLDKLITYETLLNNIIKILYPPKWPHPSLRISVHTVLSIWWTCHPLYLTKPTSPSQSQTAILTATEAHLPLKYKPFPLPLKWLTENT